METFPAKLLVVADHFSLQALEGVNVVPDFLVKPGIQFTNFSDVAVVELPDGNSRKWRIAFHLMHMIPVDRDPRKYWHVLVSFPGATKADIPIGSAVLVKSEVAARLERETVPYESVTHG